MSWIAWSVALLLIILAFYIFISEPRITIVGIIIIIVAIAFIFIGFDIYRIDNPKNFYKCTVVEKYRSNNHCYFTVKNSEFGYNTTKSSLEKYVNTNIGDTIICKGWNEDYLEYK